MDITSIPFLRYEINLMWAVLPLEWDDNVFLCNRKESRVEWKTTGIATGYIVSHFHRVCALRRSREDMLHFTCDYKIVLYLKWVSLLPDCTGLKVIYKFRRRKLLPVLTYCISCLHSLKVECLCANLQYERTAHISGDTISVVIFEMLSKNERWGKNWNK